MYEVQSQISSDRCSRQDSPLLIFHIGNVWRLRLSTGWFVKCWWILTVFISIFSMWWGSIDHLNPISVRVLIPWFPPQFRPIPQNRTAYSWTSWLSSPHKPGQTQKTIFPAPFNPPSPHPILTLQYKTFPVLQQNYHPPHYQSTYCNEPSTVNKTPKRQRTSLPERWP